MRELLIKIIENCCEEYEIIEYKREIPLVMQDISFSYKCIEDGDALLPSEEESLRASLSLPKLSHKSKCNLWRFATICEKKTVQSVFSVF